MQTMLRSESSDAFASVQVRNETVKVYFQKPTAVLSESEYKEIFNNYNLDVDFRRPDILTIFRERRQSSAFGG